MFDSILVPLDGSQLAECVLPHITAIAQSFDAEVTLLRVLEKKQTSASAQLFDLLNWQIKKTEATLYLENTRARLRTSELRARAIVLEGLVAEEITEYVQKQGMKLIILSSHGQGGLTQWGLSSITQKIILSAPTSVLLVRAHQPGIHANKSSNFPVYQRILVPLDGSQRAENVLTVVTQLARANHSWIHLVQVVQTPEMARQLPLAREDLVLSNRVVLRNRDEASRYLEQVKARSYLEGIAVQTHLITSDNAAAELHRVVEQQDIDLVTLSAHGYSGNHQWPYGNLVNNFMMYGKVSLLIVQDLPAKADLMQAGLSARERVGR